MEFSVLMSIYSQDNPRYLDEAITSVFNQNLQPSEVVIVIDGPLPDSLEKIVKKWVDECGNKIKLVELPENVGLAKALNEGLKHCSYDYVARMDSDDVCCYDRFKVQLDYMEEHADIALLGAWYKQYDEQFKNIVTERKVPEDHQSIVKYAQHRTPINHVTIVFRKSAVLAIGGYPEREGRFEDWWLSLKLIKQGYKLHNLPLYLVNVRGGDNFIQRRGGVGYLVQEVKNMYRLQAEKLITLHAFVFNVCIRALVRLVPNNLREYSYRVIRKV